MPVRTITRHTIDLLDRRPPQALQAQLERATDAVFAPPASRDGQPSLERRAEFRSGTVHYRLTLQLVDALPGGNRYRLDIEVATEDADADLPALRREAEGWIGLWTNGLDQRPQSAEGEGSARDRVALAQA